MGSLISTERAQCEKCDKPFGYFDHRDKDWPFCYDCSPRWERCLNENCLNCLGVAKKGYRGGMCEECWSGELAKRTKKQKEKEFVEREKRFYPPKPRDFTCYCKVCGVKCRAPTCYKHRPGQMKIIGF